jgi:TetR/AcrR family transcriptional repressor of nem operon
MQDLVDAMGIRKASLYATFGDKRRLYLRALRSYQADALAGMTERLSGPGSPLALLQGFLRGLAVPARGRRARRGCFCVNAAVELAGSDAEVAELLRDHGDAVEGLLAVCLRRAQHAGELRPEADCRSLAAFIYGVAVALNALQRQGAPAARLHAVAEQALAALPAS